MRHSRFPRFILFLLFIFAVLVPLGFIIVALWNNILVAIFPTIALINFWQALGIFLLSRILFGGFPGKPRWAGRRHNRQEMEEMRSKWFNLSPEERKNFKQDMRGGFRCGKTSATPETPAAE